MGKHFFKNEHFVGQLFGKPSYKWTIDVGSTHPQLFYTKCRNMYVLYTYVRRSHEEYGQLQGNIYVTKNEYFLQESSRSWENLTRNICVTSKNILGPHPTEFQGSIMGSAIGIYLQCISEGIRKIIMAQITIKPP